jgi:thioredoxin 1
MPCTCSNAEHEPARAQVDALPSIALPEFGAPWRPHCIGAQPLIEIAIAAREDVRHPKIEDGPGRPPGRSYRIMFWPGHDIALRDRQRHQRARHGYLRMWRTAVLQVMFRS